jgi:hypothetical protein
VASVTINPGRKLSQNALQKAGEKEGFGFSSGSISRDVEDKRTTVPASLQRLLSADFFDSVRSYKGLTEMLRQL